MPRRACFGTETEYAATAFDGRGELMPPDVVAVALTRRAEMRPHVDGAESGVFFPNGARFYIDGSHPEYATAEAFDVGAAVCHALAGDRLLIQLAQEVADADGIRAVVRKGSVDYADTPVTWGNHENYLCHVSPDEWRPRLIPHLVSRIIFTGSGGFDPYDTQRLRFVLSPRALFTRQAVALATVDGGLTLVDERRQPLCEGFHRLHIICGDALRSDLASFLRLGTTALVVALIEEGLDEHDAVALADPLEALQIVAGDVSLQHRLRLVDGRSASALDIQRHYLRRARANLGTLPEWAEAVCDRWQETLDLLARGTAHVSDRLDWAIKLSMYRDRATKFGLERAGLCELDTRFGQIYPPGLFDELDRAGVLRHRVEGIGDIERALVVPPDGGRAKVRGAVVARLAGDPAGWQCTWDRIDDRFLYRGLDLSDPFTQDESWRDLSGDSRCVETILARILKLPRTRCAETRATLRALVERLCAPGADAFRRQHAHIAIDLNNRGIQRRNSGHFEDAEWLMRGALAIDLDARGETHPKIVHRRMNLASVLLMQGRCSEADEQLRLAWQIAGTRYDLTSARVLLIRLALALLDREPSDTFAGQLKTHLALWPFENLADVTIRTDVDVAFEAIGARFEPEDLSLLKTLVGVLNGDRGLESLEDVERWRVSEAKTLDVPWPVRHVSGESRMQRECSVS